MVGNGGGPAVRVPIEDMAPALAHLGETEAAQSPVHVPEPDNRKLAQAATSIC